MSRRGKLSMEQIRTCPKADIKFIKEAMHRRKAARNEHFCLAITCKGHVIIESKKCKNETTQHMSGWIGRYLFKEDPLLSKRCADTAIQNISMKGANSTTCYLKKYLLLSKPVSPHKY